MFYMYFCPAGFRIGNSDLSTRQLGRTELATRVHGGDPRQGQSVHHRDKVAAQEGHQSGFPPEEHRHAGDADGEDSAES